MNEWLRHAAAALRYAGDRPALWLPGALAALAFLGWVPLLATVANLPDTGDIGFFAIGLVRSPPRIAALVLLLVTAFGLLCLLAAFGDAAIDAARRPAGPERGPTGAGTLTRLAVILVASLPALVGAGILALGIAAVAPGEYMSPAVSIPVAVRVLASLWPLVLLTVVAMVLSQALGAIAIARATAARGEPVLSALVSAAADLRRRPARRLGTAGVGLTADLLMAVLALALLRVLWAPIGLELQLGGMGSPGAILLLVGFVAIWMTLILAAGALRAAMAGWWALELGSAAVGERPSGVLEDR